MACHLRRLSKQHGIRVEIVELDLRHSRKMDFTQGHVQAKWLDAISTGLYDALLVTPPCSTFSRAPWANERGPFPLRSSRCLRGFTWNSGPRKRKANLGNSLADFSFEAMRRQLVQEEKVAFMEQPEDLGATRSPRIPGHRPGSMWQFPAHEELLTLEGVKSVALAQIDFGSESAKPTRLLLRIYGDLHEEMYEGLPQFDHDGFYMGPLPRKTGVPLIGRQNGQFKTAAAAEWPSPLCAWVAQQIVSSFLRHSVMGGDTSLESGKGVKRKATERTEEEEARKRQKAAPSVALEAEVDPFFPLVSGGEGRARGCLWKGTEVPFHDGGCLLSPGRWDIPKRKYPMGCGWDDFRAKLRRIVAEAAGGESGLERECFRMATGESGCRLVQDEALRKRLLEEVQGFCGPGVCVEEVAEGQPFRLQAMTGLLEKAGDGDYEFLKEAASGFPLGVKFPLPRTPKAFERQVEWSLKEDPTVECALAKANYPSAAEHEVHLRDHLESEVEEGLVAKMTESQFEEKYGEDRAIAALAVLVEDEATGKKRVIHDGSHGIRVNHRIRSQDKLRMPGGREKRYLLSVFREARDVVFSLIGDFGKAHRRFKYREEEHGFLGCRISEDDEYIYVNRVGTFGIASTPYWWGRLSGSLIRLCHYLIGPGVPVELLLYADDLEAMGIGKRGRIGAVLAFVFLAMVGAPFKWKKQRGGLCTEWVGLTTDYGAFSFGLSEKRAAWLVNWIRTTCAEKMVEPRIFAAALGRLGFATTALPWEKPFLGPLYKWSSAVLGQRGRVAVPWAVLMILDWIARRLETGGRMEQVPPRHQGAASPVLVYTDARASETDACLGGYLAISEDLKRCPWFSVKVDEELAPWLLSKGKNPKRVIAALELLATIIAVKLWAGKSGGNVTVRVKAFTDNRGNSFAISKGMSTKYPLTILIMELAEELREQDLQMDLVWIRREENTVADDLSNEKIDAFSPELREEIIAGEMDWKVLRRLQKRGEELYEELKSLKLQGRKPDAAKGPRATSGVRGKLLAKW